MTESPSDDTPGFVAKEPENRHDCYRLILPGKTYYLTIDNAILCPDCIRGADAIRLSGGLTVEVGEDRLLVRRGDDVVEVLPGEVRHLVDALERRLVCAEPHASFVPLFRMDGLEQKEDECFYCGEEGKEAGSGV